MTVESPTLILGIESSWLRRLRCRSVENVDDTHSSSPNPNVHSRSNVSEKKRTCSIAYRLIYQLVDPPSIPSRPVRDV